MKPKTNKTAAGQEKKNNTEKAADKKNQKTVVKNANAAGLGAIGRSEESMEKKIDDSGNY